MKTTKTTTKTLIALAIAAMVSYPGKSMAQNDSLKSPLNVEVKDSSLTVEASGTVVLNREKLDQLVLDVTQLAEVIQKETITSRQTIEEMEKEGKLQESEADLLQKQLTLGMQHSADTLNKLITTGTREEWNAWEIRFKNNMQQWRDNLQNEGVSSGIPPIPAIPQVKGNTNLIDSSTVKSTQGKRIVISSRGIEVSGGNGDKPLSIQFKEKETVEKEPNGETENSPAKDKSNRNTTTSTVNFAFGFNQLLRNGEDLVQDGPLEHQFWGSNSTELTFGLKTRIGGVNSPLYIDYALGLSWHDFKFANNAILAFDDEGNTVFSSADGFAESLENSKFKMTYLHVPILLELDFTKENYEINNGFRLGLGGYGGVRLNGKRKLEYNSANFTNIEEKAKGDLNARLLRYGLMAQAGWKNFNVNVKYDLNQFFQDDKGPDLQLFAVALGFSWD